MACAAAKRHALLALRRGPMTADEVWAAVGWWTKETIEEALMELENVERRAEYFTLRPLRVVR
jgi:hypothetical protein